MGTPIVVKSGTKKNFSPKNTKTDKTAIRSTQIKKVRKQTPPKVDILIPDPISKFPKIKNETKKRPPKVSKKSKTAIRSTQIKKVRKQTPPKVGILILDPISKFSKIKNETQKRPPKVSKKPKVKKAPPPPQKWAF